MNSGQRDDPDNITERWDINVADRQLNRSEVSLLKKGLHVSVTTQSLPVDDLITAIEMVYKNSNENTGPTG